VAKELDQQIGAGQPDSLLKLSSGNPPGFDSLAKGVRGVL